MSLSPEQGAAYAAPALLLFEAFELDLGGGAWLRLLRGAGEVSFSGKTFVGVDDAYGVLGQVEAITDGVEDEAPSLQMALLPPTRSAAAALAQPSLQGRRVTFWQGVADLATGAPIGTPDVLFLGEVDVPNLRVGQGTLSVSLDVVSAFERFFEVREGVRLSDAFHQAAWPGELGLAFVTATQRQLPWGRDEPRPGVVTDLKDQLTDVAQSVFR